MGHAARRDRALSTYRSAVAVGFPGCSLERGIKLGVGRRFWPMLKDLGRQRENSRGVGGPRRSQNRPGARGRSISATGHRLDTKSISRCLDHSAGKSVRRATPMPCGSRPSIAALMRSGARKASEIVILTFRTLQPSRFAMLSLDIDASVVSSSSQRRPRAIAATNVARVSERIGRVCCDGIPSGRRISRRRVDEVLCQGTRRTKWVAVFL